MRLFKSPSAFYKVERVDGKDHYIKITASEYASIENAQRIKRSLMQAGGNGVAIAGGMAAGEALIAGGAAAAETAAVVAAESVIVPVVLTGAAIVGVGALCYWGIKQFTEA